MPDFAIQVQGLGKKYRIGSHAPYHRFTELLTGAVTAPLRMLRSDTAAKDPAPREFWALKDVDFEIAKGDVVGVIGRNGAGKSTLLKLLSRITPPTTGTIRYRGRVGSLLEVGTGFHPELSGRDNIYLNGAILGMTRAEVRRKFDEIVAFAETERFLETPVKHYSSGMYMRLAFAVAAHLQPEILLVDEVLAVGDAEFQKKCLGKMGEVARTGRTVLFVSHNMSAIRSLCTRAALFEAGRLVELGDTEPTLTRYAEQVRHHAHEYPVRLDPQITIHHFDTVQEGQITQEIDAGRPFEVHIDYELHESLTGFRIGYFLNNAYGCLFRSLHTDWDGSRESAGPGRYVAVARVAPGLLLPGAYALVLHASCFGRIDYSHTHTLTHNVSVHPDGRYNSRHPDERTEALILPPGDWSLTREQHAV